MSPADLGASLHAGSLVVFGELHGTREAPAFVAEVAAAFESAEARDAGEGSHEVPPRWPGPRGLERCAIDGFDGVYRVGTLTPSEPLR